MSDSPKKKKKKLSQRAEAAKIERAVRETEKFLASLTHAAGLEYDDRSLKEVIQPIVEELLPGITRGMLLQKLGLMDSSYLPCEDPSVDDDEEPATEE